MTSLEAAREVDRGPRVVPSSRVPSAGARRFLGGITSKTNGGDVA